MAKMTKSQVQAYLAEKTGVSKKVAGQFLDELAELAYREAKNGFVIPGLGQVVMSSRPAREMVMQFGPKKGETIQVPAKKVVKFRFAKPAKEAILK